MEVYDGNEESIIRDNNAKSLTNNLLFITFIKSQRSVFFAQNEDKTPNCYSGNSVFFWFLFFSFIINKKELFKLSENKRIMSLRCSLKIKAVGFIEFESINLSIQKMLLTDWRKN